METTQYAKSSFGILAAVVIGIGAVAFQARADDAAKPAEPPAGGDSKTQPGGPMLGPATPPADLVANIAAANDDEMLGQEVDMHHAAVG